MQLDEIFNEWSVDSKIDPTELGRESLNIPKLHNKYLKIHSEERLRLKKLQKDLKKLKLAKWEYYTGVMDREDIIKHGWEPLSLKILKSECDKYLDADTDLIDLELKISYQEEKVEALSSIVQTINKLNFTIKNAIDYIKFQNGM